MSTSSRSDNKLNVNDWVRDPVTAPWLTIVAAGWSWIRKLQIAHRGGPLSCRIVRGREASDSPAFLREISSALQCDTVNWDALDDDLQDLSWLPAGLLLLFTNSELLLCKEDARWPLLVEMLKDANEEWITGRPIEQGGTGETRFFGAAFHCEPRFLDRLIERFAGTGARPIIVHEQG